MTDMEAVTAFNAELQSLYDVKPPISKGKMTSVTRAALKAVKLYKHAVQSVEKFIQKCKSEYKIPGLYVIDSIIRQSRHQFGAEKDVFAPRFARNIQTTFMHLYKCPEEDKSKIIRVLNLWQKNKIFSPEVIQPLFDLADPNNPIWDQIQSQEKPSHSSSNTSGMNTSSLLNNFNVPFKKEILDYDYGDDDEGGAGDSKPPAPEPNPPTNNPLGLEALGSILANPEILRQLANLQEQIAAATQSNTTAGNYSTPEQERQRKMAELNQQEAAFDQRLAQTVARLPFAVDCELPITERKEHEQNINQRANPMQNANQHQMVPQFYQQMNDQHHHTSQDMHQQQAQNLINMLGQQQQENQHQFPGMNFPIQGVPYPHQDLPQNINMFNSHVSAEKSQPFGGFDHKAPIEIDLTDDSKDKDRRDNRRRKRSRDRRSRSTSRSRSRRSRSRSRSRDRARKRYRSRSRDRKDEKDREREREKEKERARKGLPPLKKEHLSVCSTTLWVGHLSKLVSQEELSDTFGAYGDIVSIDLIPPRGCAFIVMNRRQDSLRALDRLKNTKLQGKTITLAWAPGKGVKGREWKDYWEVDSGVSYIPWSKLQPDTNVEDFEDGGCVDEDTLPDFLRGKPKSDKEKIPPPPESETSQDASLLNTSNSSNPPTIPSASTNTLEPKLSDISDISNQAQPGISGISNPAFGLTAAGVGMMPMGMPVGMVPPPLMAGAPGVPGFPGMGGIPGMPMMGIMPPALVNTTGLAPGLLGEMPPVSLSNLNQLNNTPQNPIVSNPSEEERKPSERREGKRRSRFDDPEDTLQGSDDIAPKSSPQSQDGGKDDRPLFERLKSLADGYGFGANNDKISPNLLGTAGASLIGTPAPGPRGDRLPGPRGGFGPQPLLPHGPPGGNHFNQRPPFMGERPRGPLAAESQRPWFDATNPFLNPNPNPFTGNPFVQTNMNENPFDLGAHARRESESNIGAPGAGPLSGPGPTPLFGNRPPPPDRNKFGDRDRDRHFGGRNAWDEPEFGRGRGRGNWRDDHDGHFRGRGGFRGRGRGRADPPWVMDGRDRGRDRRDDRDRESRSRNSRERDRRDRRDRSRDSHRDRRRRSEDEDKYRNSKSSDRDFSERFSDKSKSDAREENWDSAPPTNLDSRQTEVQTENFQESSWDVKDNAAESSHDQGTSSEVNPTESWETSWEEPESKNNQQETSADECFGGTNPQNNDTPTNDSSSRFNEELSNPNDNDDMFSLNGNSLGYQNREDSMNYKVPHEIQDTSSNGFEDEYQYSQMNQEQEETNFTNVIENEESNENWRSEEQCFGDSESVNSFNRNGNFEDLPYSNDAEMKGDSGPKAVCQAEQSVIHNNDSLQPGESEAATVIESEKNDSCPL